MRPWPVPSSADSDIRQPPSGPPTNAMRTYQIVRLTWDSPRPRAGLAPMAAGRRGQAPRLGSRDASPLPWAGLGWRARPSRPGLGVLADPFGGHARRAHVGAVGGVV